MAQRRFQQRSPNSGSRAIQLSAIILTAILAMLVWQAARAWQQSRRESAAWARVGHCSAATAGDTVECTGVHLVSLQLPASIKACGIGGVCTVKVNAEALPDFEAAVAEVDHRGLGAALPVFQTVSQRKCHSAATGSVIPNCISKHSYGIAFDFRPFADNGNWDTVTADNPKIMKVVKVFRQHGFRWGGTFGTNYDPQHLEWIPGH